MAKHSDPLERDWIGVSPLLSQLREMTEMPADDWDEFFVHKIEEGLRETSECLSGSEKSLLLTPAVVAAISGIFAGDEGLEFLEKCSRALTAAYLRDTADNNGLAAAEWRANNKALHESSSLVISDIVKNWYLSGGGRGAERRASGCSAATGAIAIAAAGVSMALWLILSLD